MRIEAYDLIRDRLLETDYHTDRYNHDGYTYNDAGKSHRRLFIAREKETLGYKCFELHIVWHNFCIMFSV